MGKPDGKGGGQTAADPRFAAMHSDPRFQRFPKQKNKVVVDKRFAGMFEDPDFQNRSAVDKRGRKIEARRRNEDLRRYYRLKDEDEWRQEGGAQEEEKEQEEGQGRQQQEEKKKQPGGKADVVPRRAADQGAAALQRSAQGKGKEPAYGRKGAAAEQKKEQAEAVARQKSAKRQRAAGVVPAPAVADAEKEKGHPGGAGRPAVRQMAGATGKGRKPAADQLDSSSDGSEGEQEAEELERGLGSDDEDGSLGEEHEEEEEEEEEEEVEQEEEDEEAARARERWARARGMMGAESSDEADEEGEYDSADEPLTDEEYEPAEPLDPEEWGAGSHALNPEEPIPQQEETRRLALVDLDWDHVRAVDVLVALRSFLPRGSVIERVTVYPSDYGLQRMAEEAAVGPRLILKPTQRSAAEDEKGGSAAAREADAAPAARGKPSGKKPRGGAADNDDDDGGAEVDKRRLAAYEKSRLRYYYAIVECDCVATALHLYNECDGMEFERSACKFDLRFVPDDQSFEGRQVRDSASEVPSDYQPPVHFNISLQHTDPKLSWDAEDPERKRKLQGRRLKTDEELLEADFAAYLASDDDDDDDEEEEDDVVVEEQEEEQSGDQEQASAGAGAGVDRNRQGGAVAPKAAKGRGGKEDAEALRRRYRALLLGEDAAGEDAGGAAKTKGRVGGKSWLGSEDGEESDEQAAAEAQQDKERRRGGGEPSTSGRGPGGAAGARKGDVDMVVTFHSGLEGLGERLKKKKEEERARAGETVWEAYLRKKREKRALRKAQGRLRNLSDSDDSEDYISDGEDDGRAKGRGKGKDAAAATAGKGRGAAEATGKKGKKGDDDDMYGDAPSDDPFFQHDDGEDPFADPFFQDGDDGGGAGPGARPDSGGDATTKDGKKGKKGRKDKAADGKGAGADAEKADLELLLMDDAALRDAARGVKTRVLPTGHDDADGASGKRKLTKKEKREMKKEAKRQARLGSDEEDAAGGGGEDAGEGFNVNLDDPRFADMFRSAEFALDPTDPRFKKMQARDQVLTEAKKRRAQQPKHQEPEDGKQQRQENGAAAANGGAHDAQAQQRPAAGGGTDLRIMVAKLKRKAEAQHEKERAQALGKGPKKTRL